MLGSVLRKFKDRRRLQRDIRELRAFFDEQWYLEVNPDVREHEINPIQHYLQHGWKEGRNPTRRFDTQTYLALNGDVAAAGINPFVHYIRHGLREGRQVVSSVNINEGVFHLAQNLTFPPAAEQAEHIMVIVIPEHNEMSGGIYSFFSIARTIYNLRNKHKYFTIIMTRSNELNETYIRQRNFRNSEDVFRFEQIERCKSAKTVYIHIPEYAAPSFIDNLSPSTLSYLLSREKLYVNILNQKIDIMPERDEFNVLRRVADEVTQSVAHHAYFGQEFSDRYNLPLLLLPAYTDLSEYEPLPFKDKENLIIYSPDDSSYRDRTLDALRKQLPDYELREIRGITFDEFMDLATRCRFSITFGEGFDGYLAQPIHQGGIGFAVYNEEFFPSADLRQFENIFLTGDDMADNIVSRIRDFETNPELYQKTNRAMINVYDKLYSKEDYVRRILKLIRREFEFHPLNAPESQDTTRIDIN